MHPNIAAAAITTAIRLPFFCSAALQQNVKAFRDASHQKIQKLQRMRSGSSTKLKCD